MDTPLKASIVRLALLGVQVELFFEEGFDYVPSLAPLRRTFAIFHIVALVWTVSGGCDVVRPCWVPGPSGLGLPPHGCPRGSITGGGWGATRLPPAHPQVLELVGLGVRSTAQWTLARLHYLDVFPYVATAISGAQVWALLDTSHGRDVVEALRHAPLVAVYAFWGPVLNSALLWGFLFGASPHPRALGVGAWAVGASGLLFMGSVVAFEARLGWRGAHSVIRPALFPLLHFAVAAALWVCMSARRPVSTGAPCADDRLFTLAQGPRCHCARCSAWRVLQSARPRGVAAAAVSPAPGFSGTVLDGCGPIREMLSAHHRASGPGGAADAASRSMSGLPHSSGGHLAARLHRAGTHSVHPGAPDLPRVPEVPEPTKLSRTEAVDASPPEAGAAARASLPPEALRSPPGSDSKQRGSWGTGWLRRGRPARRPPPGLCWRGRLLDACSDNVLLLRVFFVLGWILAPLGCALCAVQVNLLREAAVRDGGGAVPLALVVNLVVPGAMVLLSFLLLGYGTMMGRVMVGQRDLLVRDVVPDDVARVLIVQSADKTAQQARQTRTARKSRAYEHLRSAPALQTARSLLAGNAGLDGTLGRASVASRASRGSQPAQDRRGSATSGRTGRPDPRTGPPGGGSAREIPLGGADGGGRAQGAVEFTGPSFMWRAGGLDLPPAYRRDFAEVSVMFSDLVGFTGMSSAVSPEVVFQLLHSAFGVLDSMTEDVGVTKYETVGDAYITLASREHNTGREWEAEHPVRTLSMAVSLVQVMGCFRVVLPSGEPWLAQARVGCDLGPISSGVVGHRRRLLSVTGDTVNTAARMESHSLPGHVQCTERFFRALPPPAQALFAPREVQAKGKGTLRAHLLDVAGRSAELHALGLGLVIDDPVAEGIPEDRPPLARLSMRRGGAPPGGAGSP